MSTSWNNLTTLLTDVLSTSKLKKSEQETVLNNWNSKQTQISALLASAKGKKVKDPNAPTRNKSGYMLFCDDNRAEVRKHVEKQTEVTKRLGEMWKNLSESKKQAYKDRAGQDKERYEREMETYKPSDSTVSVKPKKVKKESTGPRRPTSAFLFFTQHQRPLLKEKNPELSGSAVASRIGEMWRELTDDEKKPFQEQYEVDHQRFLREKESLGKETKPVKETKPTKSTKETKPTKSTKETTESKESKKAKEDSKSKKSTPGQQLFFDERRDDVISDATHRTWSTKQVNSELTRMWNALTKSEQEAYEREAEEEASEQEMED